MAKSASVSEVRAWAKDNGFDLGDRGRLPAEVWTAWEGRRKASAPAQRTALKQPAGASAEDLAAAQRRIDQLEEQVAELSELCERSQRRSEDLAGRVDALEQALAKKPRRFGRS